jgi:signal transduction histidine kinase
LEHPGWWTLQRLFAAFGLIMLILAGALLWIFTLKRQVHAQALMIHQKVEREATLEERARIARDIHDTLEQALAGTSLQLNALADSMHGVSQEAQRILKVARSMINHAQAEARRTVRNLRLLDLEKHNLPTALSRFATTSGDDSHVKIVVAVNGRYQSLPNQVENHLLRIGQEAVTNAIKHAGAGTVRIELNCEPRWLNLSIHDDGCGFSPANAFGTSSGHFGLLGMRERAEKIGGTFLATSSPGQGTIISVRISVPEQVSDLSNPGSYLARPKSE